MSNKGSSVEVHMYSLNGEYEKTFCSLKDAADELNVVPSTIWKAINFNRKHGDKIWSYHKYDNILTTTDNEIIKKTVRLAKDKQKLQDTNRIERKSFREYSRIENAVAEYNKALIEKFDEVEFNVKTTKHKDVENPAVLIVQIADPHFNELVDLPHNKYDFTIASKRLQRYAERIKKYAKTTQANKILVIMTGDLLNSDRRLDELLSMATNRAKATLIAINLLQQFILDLNTIANVEVGYVSGNESRVKEEWGWTEILATDNYDTSIFNMLQLLFKGKKGIDFINGNSPNELVLNINKNNILFLHGHSIKNDAQKTIQQICGKYSGKGIRIDYVIYGHIHFANITDLFARSGSLVGSNAYADYELNLISKASQNIHAIFEDGTIENTRIELQNTSGYEGYYIDDDLEAYNVKSLDKISKPKETVIKVVI